MKIQKLALYISLLILWDLSTACSDSEFAQKKSVNNPPQDVVARKSKEKSDEETPKVQNENLEYYFQTRNVKRIAIHSLVGPSDIDYVLLQNTNDTLQWEIESSSNNQSMLILSGNFVYDKNDIVIMKKDESKILVALFVHDFDISADAAISFAMDEQVEGGFQGWLDPLSPVLSSEVSAEFEVGMFSIFN